MVEEIKTTFFIGGAPKAGTTSMWNYLSQHPNIYMGEEKEIYYFTHKYNKDKKWYIKKYKKYSGEKEVGDGSINILASKKAARRINKDLEDPKIIFIFRDPVERLISNYKFALKRGESYATTKSFSEWLREIRNSEDKWTLKLGLYKRNLDIHEKYFGKESVKCILFEDFISETESSVRDVYSFLDVREDFVPKFEHENDSGSLSNSKVLRALYRLRNSAEQLTGTKLRSPLSTLVKQLLQRSSSPVRPSESDLRFLADYYKEDICKLQKHLGRDLSHWLERFEGA